MPNENTDLAIDSRSLSVGQRLLALLYLALAYIFYS